MCSVPPKCQGHDGERKTEEDICNTQPCDCVWQDWHPWSDCSSNCGVGTRRRRREGQYCGKLSKEEVQELCWEKNAQKMPNFQ